MSDFKGKVAVISGGTSGIGLGIAQACVREGMKVIITGRRENRMQEALEKLRQIPGAEVAGFKMDATVEEDHHRLAEFAKETFGGVYMMVNSAGIGLHGKFESYSDNDWNYILKSNLWSIIYNMRTFLPIFDAQEEGGYMVNISSMGGLSGTMSTSAYSATKFAVNGLTQSIFRERVMAGEDEKVHFVIVCPALVATNVEYTADEMRPAEFKNEKEQELTEFDKNVITWYKQVLTPEQAEADPENTYTPEKVGEIVMQGIKDGKMWIITHENSKPGIIQNAEEIVSGYQYM